MCLINNWLAIAQAKWHTFFYRFFNRKSKLKTNTIMSFLRGVLAGLAIGYLTAPRSGKETREKLSQGMDDLQRQWEDGVDQVKSQVDRVVGKASNSANQYANEAEQIFDKYKEEGQAKADQKLGQAKRAYNNTVDNAANSAEEGIDRAQEALKID